LPEGPSSSLDRRGGPDLRLAVGKPASANREGYRACWAASLQHPFGMAQRQCLPKAVSLGLTSSSPVQVPGAGPTLKLRTRTALKKPSKKPHDLRSNGASLLALCRCAHVLRQQEGGTMDAPARRAQRSLRQCLARACHDCLTNPEPARYARGSARISRECGDRSPST
jgi:hypothetical protein